MPRLLQGSPNAACAGEATVDAPARKESRMTDDYTIAVVLPVAFFALDREDATKTILAEVIDLANAVMREYDTRRDIEAVQALPEPN